MRHETATATFHAVYDLRTGRRPARRMHARWGLDEVYPGIGVRYYGSDARIEQDFEIAAGADARRGLTSSADLSAQHLGSTGGGSDIFVARLDPSAQTLLSLTWFKRAFTGFVIVK